MAQQLDLQEQEQIDALKAFWGQYGNLITWTLTLVLGAYALWNGLQYLERSKALRASTLYTELESAAAEGDVDRVKQIFADMKTQTVVSFLPRAIAPIPTYTVHAGLMAARRLATSGQLADAIEALHWVVDHGDAADIPVARLRLAGLLADQKKFDAALGQLDQITSPSFAALVADRRGDILAAKGDRAGAKAAYEAAYQGLQDRLEYRLLVDAKRTALDASPAAPATAGVAATASGPAAANLAASAGSRP